MKKMKAKYVILICIAGSLFLILVLFMLVLGKTEPLVVTTGNLSLSIDESIEPAIAWIGSPDRLYRGEKVTLEIMISNRSNETATWRMEPKQIDKAIYYLIPNTFGQGLSGNGLRLNNTLCLAAPEGFEDWLEYQKDIIVGAGEKIKAEIILQVPKGEQMPSVWAFYLNFEKQQTQDDNSLIVILNYNQLWQVYSEN